MRVGIGMVAGLALHGAALAQAPEGVERVLIDRELAARRVLVTSIDDRNVGYVDSAGLIRQEPLNEYVAIVPLWGAPTPVLPTVVLQLADGRRFLGDGPTSLRPAPGHPDSIEWAHEAFGVIRIPLDSIASIRLATAPADRTTPPGDTDALLLVNGDSLAGFLIRVESVDGGAAIVRFESGGREIEIPVDRIARLVLAGARVAPTGRTIWLRWGDVVQASTMTTVRGPALEFSSPFGPPSANRWSVPLAAVDAVLTDASRLVALASLTPTAQRTTGGRPFLDPAQVRGDEGSLLGAPDLILPGPMEVEWAMPEGARRLGFEAALADAASTWGDCEVVVLVDGSELWRAELRSDSPTQAANLALPRGGTLTIRTDAGAYGPVQDRVVLRRPIILRGSSGG